MLTLASYVFITVFVIASIFDRFFRGIRGNKILLS